MVLLFIYMANVKQDKFFANPLQQAWANQQLRDSKGRAVTASKKDRTSFGGKPNPAEIDKANSKIVRVLYGHHGSGKTYDYLAPNNVRTGQIITPPVNHYKSGKLYNTLGRVVATMGKDSIRGKASRDNLQKKGIPLKNIGATNQQILPSYYKGWGKDAAALYELKQEALKNKDDVMSADVDVFKEQVKAEGQAKMDYGKLYTNILNKLKKNQKVASSGIDPTIEKVENIISKPGGVDRIRGIRMS